MKYTITNEALKWLIAKIKSSLADKADKADGIIYSGADDGSSTDVQSVTEEVLQKVYPVGAVYIGTSSANPRTILGFGTWAQIKDRFLLAAGDSYTAGSTGGAAAVALAINEMPQHGHKVYNWTGNGDSNCTYTATVINPDTNEFYTAPDGAKLTQGWNSSTFKTWGAALHEGAGDPTGSTGFAGHSAAHNNMPPYLTVYMWQRTA